MKHDMAEPCTHCPFRTDIHGYLTRARVGEIVASVMQGQSFPCHNTTKTIVDDDGEDRVADSNSQECAGASIFLAHNGRSTQMSRIAERLGMKVSTLNMEAPVVKSMTEMLKVHCGTSRRRRRGEHCAVVNDDCTAPAGYATGGGMVEGTEYVTTTCVVCGEHVCEECSKLVLRPKKRAKQRVCDNCRED